MKQIATLLAGFLIFSIVSPSFAAGRGGAKSTKGKSSKSSKKKTPPPPLANSPGKTIVFFEMGLRSDLGTFTTREIVETTDDSFETEVVTDAKSLGPMIHMGFLTHLYGPFRIGGALGYGMNLKLVERPTSEQEEDDNFEAQEFRFGQLVTLDFRLEFSKHLGHKFWLVITPRGGASIIQVGEDLREASEALSETHNIHHPRMGLILGGDFGLRYQHTPWFGIRGTFGLAYAGQSYLKATRNGAAGDSDRSWSSSMSRMSWGLAGEASF